MAALIFGCRCPCRLVQMEELASRYSRPFTSRSTAPLPSTMTSGSRGRQSRIWVNVCQTTLGSSFASVCIGIFDLRFAIYDWFQRAGEHRNVLRRVAGGQSNPQPRRPARHRWKADRRDENVLLAQLGGGGDCFGLIAENDRDDGALGCSVMRDA